MHLVRSFRVEDAGNSYDMDSCTSSRPQLQPLARKTGSFAYTPPLRLSGFWRVAGCAAPEGTVLLHGPVERRAVSDPRRREAQRRPEA